MSATYFQIVWEEIVYIPHTNTHVHREKKIKQKGENVNN